MKQPVPKCMNAISSLWKPTLKHTDTKVFVHQVCNSEALMFSSKPNSQDDGLSGGVTRTLMRDNECAWTCRVYNATELKCSFAHNVFSLLWYIHGTMKT